MRRTVKSTAKGRTLFSCRAYLHEGGQGRKPLTGIEISKRPLNGAAEMICSLFEAPADLAPQLKLTVELDPSATQAQRS
ncbi:hypothetical protein P3T39_006751 [Kitasatospora sp. GP82]|nr:hypothetical protein [Kitasatospora sp. GP82]